MYVNTYKCYTFKVCDTSMWIHIQFWFINLKVDVARGGHTMSVD